MWRIEPIGPRRELPEGVLPVSASERVDRHHPDERERREREREARRRPRRPPPGPEQHPVEPGHVDVSV